MATEDCTGRIIHIGDWITENPFFPRCDSTFAVWRGCKVTAFLDDGYIETTDSDGEKATGRAETLKVVR